jgi:hypothetical protein
LRQLVLSQGCVKKRLTNNTFVHLANTSLTTLMLAGCSPSLLAIEPCVFCPLRNLTAVDIRETGNKILSLDSALSTFYAFTVNGQKVRSFKADNFVYSESRAVGFHLSERSMRHVHGTCVRELGLSSNFIVAVERDALVRPGSLFNKCVQRLDLSHNAIFYADPHLSWTLDKFLQLEELELQQQRTFSLERAELVLSKQAVLSWDAYEEHKFSLSLILPPQIRFFNFSGACFLVGRVPDKVIAANVPHFRTMDMSYNRMIGCMSVFQGLESGGLQHHWHRLLQLVLDLLGRLPAPQDLVHAEDELCLRIYRAKRHKTL